MDLDEIKKQYKSIVAKKLSEETKISSDEIIYMFEEPRDRKHGYMALPCFKISPDNPKVFAEEWAKRFDQMDPITSTTHAASVGPFINFQLKSNCKVEYGIKSVLDKIRNDKNTYGKPEGLEGQTVVVDFSSANIAKPFGVGHLRSTVIGNALASMYEFAGCTVEKINHIGDWGKQFGLLDVAYTEWGDEVKLKQDPIQHLYELYVDINKKIEEGDEELDEKGREAFRKLEEGNLEHVERWERFRELSVEEFKKVYNRLNVSFDSYNGEAFFNDKMDDTISRMEKAGVVTQSQGALVADLEDEGLGVAIIRKSNSSTTYLTRDISAAEYRYETYAFDKLLYVVGHPQELHFKQLFAILRKMGYEWVDRCEHVMFGYIQGMSTRKGTIVFLNDLLDEAKDRVLKRMDELSIQKVQGKDQEKAAEDIGITAVLFSDMKNKRIKDIEFDWDRMLSLQGDTGPYLQNVLARIFGIFRKVDIELPEQEIDWNLLNEEKAQDVVDELRRFPDIIKTSLRLNEPSVITNYLLEIASQFHSAYNVLTVKGSEENLAIARLLLFDCVKQVCINAFSLLGFRILEEM